MRCSVLIVVALFSACQGDLPPALSGDALIVAEDDAVRLSLQAVDPNEDIVSFVVSTEPMYGTATLDGDVVTYTPNPDFNGEDAFEVTPTAAGVDGPAAAFSVTVNPVNDAPKGADYTASMDEDAGPLNDTVVGTDVDEDELTYTMVGSASLGQIEMQADGRFSYQPDADATGTERLAFEVSDGIDSAVGTMTITVGPVDDAPTAVAASLSVTEDGQISGILQGLDPEGSALTAAIASGVSNGILTLDDATTGAFTYVPAADFSGSDAFTFTITADGVASEPAAVSITVTPVDDPPVPVSASVTTVEDATAAVVLDATDVDSTSLSWRITSQGTLGTAFFDSNELVYVPDPDQHGDDTVTVAVTDGTTEVEATVSISITPSNDVPTVDDLSVTLAEDTFGHGVLTGDDVDGDAITFALASGSDDGVALVQANGTWDFEPDSDFAGTTTFTFTATDGEGVSEEGTVTLVFTPVNDEPIAMTDRYDAYANLDIDVPAHVGVLANDIDVDGDELSVVVETVATSAGGSVTLNADGSFHYTIGAGVTGTDTFTYTATDSSGMQVRGSAEVELTRTVWFVDSTRNAPNVAPVASELNDAVALAQAGDLIYMVNNGEPYDVLFVDLPVGVEVLGSGTAFTAFGFDALPAGDRTALSGWMSVYDGCSVGSVQWVESDSDAAMQIPGDGVTVHDVQIVGSQFGIVSNGADLTMRNVTIDGATLGLWVTDASGIHIQDSTINASGFGMSLQYEATSVRTGTLERVVVNDTTGVGVHVQWRGDEPGGELVLRDVDIAAAGGKGLNVQFEHSEYFTDAPVVEVVGGSMTGDLDYGVYARGWNVGNGMLSMDGVTIGSAGTDNPAVGIYMEAHQGGEMAFAGHNLSVMADEVGVQLLAENGSPLPMNLADSTFTMDSGTGALFTVTDGGSVELDMSNVDFGNAPEGLSYTSGDGASVLMDLQDNEALAYTFDIHQYSSLRFVTESWGETLTDTDGGLLEAQGNTTNGGAPVVSVSGDISPIGDPAAF